MDIDYNKLKFFLEVVRCGGPTAAAKELHRTQSAVSQAVSSLERSLGVKLITWEGKSLQLTREGKHLFQAAIERMQAIDEELIAIKSGEELVGGTIELGLLQDYSTNMQVVVFDAIASFRKTHPTVTFHVHFATSRQIEEALVDRSLDMGFLINIQDPHRFHLTEIATEQHLIVTTPEYIQQKGKLLGVQDVLSCDLIDIDRHFTCFTPWVMHHASSSFEILASKVPSCIVPNFLSIRQLVLANQGIAVLPHYLIADELQSGAIVQVLPELVPLRVWVSCAIDCTHRPRLAEKLFLEKLRTSTLYS